MDYSQIYFAVLSVSTIAIAGILILSFLYVLSILRDIKALSNIAKKEAMIIAQGFEKGASLFGSQLSSEASGFLRTVFSLLLTQFGNAKNSRRRSNKVKQN